MHIISGFLGAGKTTVLRRILADALEGVRVAVIQNEFGEVRLTDALPEGEVPEMRELSEGCICCTLLGSFTMTLHELARAQRPAHILIEPSGAGKLSDIRKAVEISARQGALTAGGSMTVADVTVLADYLEDFGDFYRDQITAAGVVFLSHTDMPGVSGEAVRDATRAVRSLNPRAQILTGPAERIGGKALFDALLAGRTEAPQLAAGDYLKIRPQ